MITGGHVVVYSEDADADRRFFQDVLGFPHVDVGGGWLIFALPPSELAVHPSGGSEGHELYLMCDDLGATIAELTAKGVTVSEVTDARWGRVTSVMLPGGGSVGLYEPRHERPENFG